jgi:hypothetical protein
VAEVWVGIENGPACLVVTHDLGAPIGVQTCRRFTGRYAAGPQV